MSAATVAQNNRESPKAFFVFDLDETIGRFSSPFYFVWAFLFPEMERNKQTFIGDFTTALRKRYNEFVKEIGQAEASDTPLGILRPGILDIFAKIAKYKDAGLLGGVAIFSNNGTLQMLEFARDVIHEALGRQDIICDCIPQRDKRRSKTPEKIFYDVHTIFTTGPCRASTVSPQQVMFFDDLIHQNMLNAIGSSNYIQIQPYTHDVPVEQILPYFLKVVETNTIVTSEKLSKYWASKMLKKVPTNKLPKDVIVDFLLKSQPSRNASANAPEKDESYIQTILDQMDSFVERVSSLTPSLTKTYKPTLSLNNNLYSGGLRTYRQLYSAKKRFQSKWNHKRKTKKNSRRRR